MSDLTSKRPSADVALSDVRWLSAGGLSAELDQGSLRHICFNGLELLSEISFFVRDADWGTWPGRTSGATLTTTAEGFVVDFQGRAGPAGDDLVWDARITGTTAGHLTYACVARVQRTLLTNRTGFILIHPLAMAGTPIEVLTCAGTKQSGHFPTLIEPWQPFVDIKSLIVEPAAGVKVAIELAGDAFEMEDQRNWTDPSFKTYVRSMDDPRPYELAQGSTFAQSVTLKVSDSRTQVSTPDTNAPISVSLDPAVTATLPALGIAVAVEAIPDALLHRTALRRLAPAFVMLRLDMREPDLTALLLAIVELHAAINTPVVLEVVMEQPSDAQVLAAALKEAGLEPQSIQVSPASDLKGVLPGAAWPEGPGLAEYYRALRQALPDQTLGGGTFAFFTELNRKRPPLDDLDYVTFTTCPIVHDAQDEAVMATLDSLPFITQSVQAIVAGRPFHVGPVSLAARDNPYGVDLVPNPNGERLALSGNDPRQREHFALPWNLGYFAGMAWGGAKAVTLSAFSGERGVIDAQTGAEYPLFDLLAQLATLASTTCVAVHSTDARIVALATSKGPDVHLLLANRSAERLTVHVEDLVGSTCDYRVLGTQQAPQPSHDGKYTLDAYQTLHIIWQARAATC
jgi:hypothetical protein